MMNVPAPKLMSESDIQVGEAWSRHYHGQNEEALTMFRGIVEAWPEHIDARYGLALCLRKADQKSQAADEYRKVQQLVQAELTKQLEDNARFHMLARMVEQQLATL